MISWVDRGRERGRTVDVAAHEADPAGLAFEDHHEGQVSDLVSHFHDSTLARESGLTRRSKSACSSSR